MVFVGNITLLVLVAPTFAILASVSLELALSLSVMIAFALSIGITIPTLSLCLEIAIGIALGISVSVGISLPSVSVALGLSISAQLTIVLGLVVAVKAILALAVGAGANLEAFTYVGAGGSTMGNAVASALTSGWPDGTPPAATVTALVLMATSTGPGTGDAVQSVSLLAAPTGAGPPAPPGGGGLNYERGLCSVAFSAPPLGGTQATGTPTIVAGVITGINVTDGGMGYVTPPSMTVSDTVPITGATNATPIVVTVADTTDLMAVTLTNVLGNTAASGQWCAKVLSGTTFALYHDGAFTMPSVGNGTWIPGSGTPQNPANICTGSGVGAAGVPVMGGGAVRQMVGFFDGLVFPGSGLSSGITIGINVMLSVVFGLLLDLLGNLQLQAKILATASAKFGLVPPAVSGNVQILAKVETNLKAAIAFQPPVPSIHAKLSAALSAKIAIVASLVGRISLLLGYATETIAVYTYTGPGSGLGPAISAAIPGTSGTAVILGATSSGSQTVLGTFFAGAGL